MAEEASSDDREESTDERLDRELGELLQELRVAMPGVQVLLAFLLVAPLNQRFPQLQDSGQIGWVISLIGAVLASILLIAPSAYHRLRWRQGDKERLLRRANVMVLLGLFFIAVAINVALYVIVQFIFGTAAGITLAVITGLLSLFVWYALPFLNTRRRDAPDGT
jgi:MFS family permease